MIILSSSIDDSTFPGRSRLDRPWVKAFVDKGWGTIRERANGDIDYQALGERGTLTRSNWTRTKVRMIHV